MPLAAAAVWLGPVFVDVARLVTFVVAVAPLVWLLWTVLAKGFTHVLNANWWQKSLAGLTGRQAGGGVYHAIYGTLIQSVMCAVIGGSVGLATSQSTTAAQPVAASGLAGGSGSGGGASNARSGPATRDPARGRSLR